MAITKLYNLDESRSEIYEQEFQIAENSDGRFYLDHLPKEGSLFIKNQTTGIVLSIVDNDEPLPDQVFLDYRSEYDYVAAKGVLIFNKSDVARGYTFYARYIPVASRVDAGVLNQIIDVCNNLNGEVWTKNDLAGPVKEDIISWRAIEGRPEMATEYSAGLVSAIDQSKLNKIPYNFAVPSTGVRFNRSDTFSGISIAPTSWGEPLDFKLGNSFVLTQISPSELSLDVSDAGIRGKIGLKANYVAALAGAMGDGKSTEEPSQNNKYVLDNDIRLTDYRNPLAHIHNIADITGLPEELEGKSNIDHTHSVIDITGWEAVKGDPGISPTVVVDSTITGAAGTQALVENVTGDPYNIHLKFTIPKGADGTMRWSDLTEEQKAEMQIVGDKGDTGDPAALIVTGVHTGVPGTDVIIETTGPEQRTIEGQVYRATTMDITIPRGDKGDTGLPSAVYLGSVTTTENNTEAKVVVHPPVVKEFDGDLYSASQIDFELPRGPKGTASASRLSFTEDDENWSDIDEDENYTLTLRAVGAVPVTLPFESIGNGLFETTIASVKFDYTNLYIVCDHKFSGYIYVEGVA